MSTDYKSTVFLPKTDFPMKAGLPDREPAILKRWENEDLYHRQREISKDRERFILHDGPPYANGHLHIGHALNKILKDVISRSQQMMGRDSIYVPGWDCHGLPIEWKIEEEYRKKGKDKDQIPIIEFRQECREFANKWIKIQRDEFKRLGVLGDWSNPYTTMTYAAEAQIVRELGKFLINGALYKGAKPVMWSPVEKTALAEAEIEYHNHTSTTIHVRFPIKRGTLLEIEGAGIIIWTTTPWTMPGNRAVAVGPNIDYSVIKVSIVNENSMVQVGDKLVIATLRLEEFCHEACIESHEVLANVKGSTIAGSLCQHPLSGLGYEHDVPVLEAEFATTEDGTGIIHIAPGHGTDDWLLGRDYGIEVPRTVDENGCFYAHVPIFAGKHVYKVNDDIAETLNEAGNLIAKGKLNHRYPHSWRSKAPLIFRNTSQWFISMEATSLRDTALEAIANTKFIPESGRTRLRDMIAERPDWCVSRQRAWGVPITVFVHKESGEPLRDQIVLDRVANVIEIEGADAWFTSDPSRFLGDDYRAEDYEQVMDILDVWFDSGSTHSYVLEKRDDLQWPASLYLEGTDQHRGWFHSSLLESCGTRGRAPYDAVLTHGFVMAEDGQKMSKSLGNIVSPHDVVNQHGADILRLWVVGSDYADDLRIGPEILKYHSDIYRRLRNTLRYLLGNLNQFSKSERVDTIQMPELDRWVLHRIWEIDKFIRDSCDNFDFHHLFSELHNFCAIDLSSFYLDIRKDSLYCDRVDTIRRRSARTVLDTLFDCLTAWLAPFICFTAEEAWRARHGEKTSSIHLRSFPDIPSIWRDDALNEKWQTIRQLRRVVTGALELERTNKRIGSSLQASPIIYADQNYIDALQGLSKAEISDLFITSGATFSSGDPPVNAFSLSDIDGVAVFPQIAKGEKCQRCWKILPDVGSNIKHPDVCSRCADSATHAN